MQITITATPEEVEQALSLKTMLEDQGNEVAIIFKSPSGDGFYNL